MKERKLRNLIREEAKNLINEKSASPEYYQEVIERLREDYPFLGPFTLGSTMEQRRIEFYADDGSGGRKKYYISITDLAVSDKVDLTLRTGSGRVVDVAGDVDPINAPKVIMEMLT